MVGRAVAFKVVSTVFVGLVFTVLYGKTSFALDDFLQFGSLFDDYSLFYRCGHCKKLAPEYEKLAASFKKAKSVLIAKVHLVHLKTICTLML